MMWSILTSDTDTSPDAKCDRLDKLYKVLLLPTTFYISISWLLQTHLWNMAIERPQLIPLTPPATEQDLLIPIVWTAVIASALGISIVFFLLFVFVKHRKGLIGRFIAFWFLLFVLILTIISYVQAIPPFTPLPLPSGEVILALVIMFAGALSGYLVWKA